MVAKSCRVYNRGGPCVNSFDPLLVCFTVFSNRDLVFRPVVIVEDHSWIWLRSK